MVDSLIVNAVRGKRGRPAKPDDFVMTKPKGKRSKKQDGPSDLQMLHFCEMLNIGMGGSDTRKKAEGSDNG